jgi:hypothetical protein
MADAADDRDLVAKSARPVGPPPRSGEAMRRLADFTYPPIPDGESRCLSVGRGITLSGEVNSCDKLLIEGSVDAKHGNAVNVAYLVPRYAAAGVAAVRRPALRLDQYLFRERSAVSGRRQASARVFA